MLDLQRAYEINFYERANETCLIFKSLSNMSHLRRVRHYYYKRVQIDFKQPERGIPFHRVIDVITGNIFKGDRLDSLLWAYSIHRTHTHRFSKHISYYNPIAFYIILHEYKANIYKYKYDYIKLLKIYIPFCHQARVCPDSKLYRRCWHR